MIQSAKYFNYNNIDLSSFPNMRIGNESNDMYAVQIIGDRSLREEKIPGRQAPYFYGLEDSPLTVSITVALDQPKTISELRSFFRWLYNQNEYKKLVFDTDPNKIYYALFIGQPQFIYIDRSIGADINENNRKLIGYITLQARCNAGTAFSPAIQIIKVNPVYTTLFDLNNNGDNIVFPSLTIKMGNTTIASPDNYLKLKIENLTNGSYIEFLTVYRNEEITVDMSTRIINTKDGIVSQNIYESWTRSYLSLESGSNNIRVEIRRPSNNEIYTYPINITFVYQPVRYI
jgi:predicted phage tail component-like protein